MENKKIEDLEHDLIYKELENVSFKMHEGFSSIDKSLKAILVETRKTNGRVNVIEETIDFIHVLKKYKWLLILVTIGIYSVLEVLNLGKLINMFL